MLYPLADIAPDLEVPGLGRCGLRARVPIAARAVVSSPETKRRRRARATATFPRSATSSSKGPSASARPVSRDGSRTLEAELVLEQDAQNPFLERFYRNPKSGALPAQLFFLFQRAQQLGTLKQQDLFAPRRVADYLFEKDRLFASLTLDAAGNVAVRAGGLAPRRRSTEAGSGRLSAGAGRTLLQRIAKRGIAYESRHRRGLSRAAQRRVCAFLPRIRYARRC